MHYSSSMTWHINNEMNDLEEVKEEMISDTSLVGLRRMKRSFQNKIKNKIKHET